jgi:hypothetical protein
VADVSSGLSLTPHQETKKRDQLNVAEVFILGVDVLVSLVPVASVWTTGTKIGLNNKPFGTTHTLYVMLQYGVTVYANHFIYLTMALCGRNS